MPKRASLQPLKTTGRSAKWAVNVPAKYSETGRRERHFFSTKDVAETFCAQIRTRLENYGTQATLLSPGQAEQATQAFEKLLPYGVSLNVVVEEWIARRRQAEASVLFEQLLDEFANAGRRNRQRSAGYRKSILQTRNRLTSLHRRIVSEITPQEIEKAVKPMKPSVRNYTLRILACAFNLGVVRGYLAENPVRRVEQTDIPSKEITVYTPRQVAKVMAVALEHEPALVPYYAIGFFAGIRRSELLRMDWSHVRVRERYIRLPKEITKTGQGRHIPVETNLAKWLGSHVQDSGPIVPCSSNQLREKERDLRGKHKVKIIKHGPRHCYGTYWLAMHENIDRLMLSMGHTNFETTQEHYAKAATRKDARLFWKIAPPMRKGRKITPSFEAAQPREEASA